jgi:hypothetical protein
MVKYWPYLVTLLHLTTRVYSKKDSIKLSKMISFFHVGLQKITEEMKAADTSVYGTNRCSDLESLINFLDNKISKNVLAWSILFAIRLR